MILRHHFVVALSVLVVFLLGSVQSVAVMSVDLGSEWMKVAVVSPGVPMEIALNAESKRKTAAAVALRNGERVFGADALAMGTRHPKNCYFYLVDILGKKFDNPAVAQYQKRYPFYELKEDPERGTVLFQHDENTVYSPEELVAMILSHAKHIAEEYTEQKVKDVVITVPVFYDQAERRALETAAELAGLNLLQLISEPMAVALNYGMFRRKEINATVKHLMFYDMGAQDTTVAVVAFQVIKTKERGFTETHPQAQILGVGYDRSLGGTELNIRMRDFLAKKFNEMGKTNSNAQEVPRALGKLFKEASRVKTVLSANNDVYAQVENVMENIDFRVQISRDDLLEMNADLFERLIHPIDMALKTADMTVDAIDEIILVGAGTRVPKVQSVLKEYLGRELGKNLNTDEAAAMGAVYKAADLSSGFKVKKFITKEAVVFPIDVDFERKFEDDNGQPATKRVRKSLFSRMNPFPQKKIMTFNKFTGDFTFHVNHADLEYLGETEISQLGSPNISSVDVKGVAAALENHTGDNIESKGVKAHFAMDDSGMIQVTSVEAVFEKTISVEEQEAAEKVNGTETEGGEKKDDTWAKLGDTISSFFGADKEGADGENAEKEANETGKDSKDKKEKKDKDKKDKKKEEKKKEPKKPKVETIKEPLEFSTTILAMPPMSEDTLKASRAKLEALDENDRERKHRETSLNALESYVIDIREKLYEDLWDQSSTDEEKEKIREKCSEISDWIDEEYTPETEVSILETKLQDLKKLTAALTARVREHRDRPEALDALNGMISGSRKFLAHARNQSGDDALFTEVELNLLETKIKDLEDWRDEQVKAQEAQPMSEMPKLTTTMIGDKGVELDREVKYLVNKAKIAKAEKEREKRKKEAEEAKAKEEAEKKKKKEEKKKKKSENATKDEEATTEENKTTEQEDSPKETPDNSEEDTTKSESESPETPPEDSEAPVNEEGSDKESDKEEEAENAEEEKPHTEL